MWVFLACGGPAPIPDPPPVHTTPPDPGDPCVAIDGPDVCDGVDSDCDAAIDEDPDRLWYLDGDGDGLGDEASAVAACEAPPRHVADFGDCVDHDASVWGGPGPVGFEMRRPAESGLNYPHWDGFTRPCIQEELVGGAAVGDLDDDGDLDLFLPRLYQPDVLLLNDATGRFAPLPGFAGDPGASSGALFFDVDGDRDLDLMVARLGNDPNLLYINQGSGIFTEEAAARGVDLPAGGCGDQYGVTAGDVDGDGDLDLLIAGWQEEHALGQADRSKLLLNDSTGHFVDATEAWGLDLLIDRAAFSMLLADIDDDGRPDLHLVADWGGTTLFRNLGDRFVPLDATVFTDENGMGSDLGDVDGDGTLDWFVGSIYDPADPCPPGWGCSGNRLYMGGVGGYTDGTDAAGVRNGQWTWGAVFVDVDLDADLDLVTTGGFGVEPFVGRAGHAWTNDGSGRFSDATCALGLDWVDPGRTWLPLDADRDGDQDLVLVGPRASASLWMASGAEDNGWIEIVLDQPGPNPYGIGARITVRTTADAVPQTRLLHANSLYLGGPAPEVHLGLGDHTGPVHEVVVRWPDGATTVHPQVGPGVVRLVR